LFDGQKAAEVRLLLHDGNMQMGRFASSAKITEAVRSVPSFKAAYVVLNPVDAKAPVDENGAAAVEFRRVFSPAEITMEYRLPKVENLARQHGLTLGRIAARSTDVAELAQTTVVMRAQAYRRNVFAELDRVKDLLLL
jgi:hypothetical protein